jgi:hypothetical protein
MVTLGEQLLHLSDMPALVLSSAMVLGWNFGWSKYIVWRDAHPAEDRTKTRDVSDL